METNMESLGFPGFLIIKTHGMSRVTYSTEAMGMTLIGRLVDCQAVSFPALGWGLGP